MFNRFAVVLLALLFTASAANAKDLNVAFVNGQQIFDKYRSEIDERLVKEFGERKDKIIGLQDQLKKNVEKLERAGATMSKPELAKLKRTAEGQQRELQRLSQAYQEDFGMRGNQELQHLGDKLQAVVNKYAKAHNLDMVLQRGAAVFVDKRFDITEKILVQLNK